MEHQDFVASGEYFGSTERSFFKKGMNYTLAITQFKNGKITVSRTDGKGFIKYKDRAAFADDWPGCGSWSKKL